jgi:cell division protein ZapA
MSQKLPITLRIAERSYPMEVDREDEARLRAVGKQINQQLKHYKDVYGVTDSQDLLAIYAVDCSMEKESLKEALDTYEDLFLSKINSLEEIIDLTLQRSENVIR